MLTDAEKLAERRAKRFWVSLVVFLLGIQIAVGGTAIYLATGDPSVAIVPNYHQEALNWDAALRARRAARRMGWSLELNASDVADTRGMRALVLTIRDSQSESADGLRVAGRVYHHARASDLRPVKFHSVGDGRYMAMAPMARAGLWQVEITIDGADELMTMAETVEVGAPASQEAP